MKKFILTFALTLVSLMSFTQNYLDTLNVDTVTCNQTIYVYNSDSLIIHSFDQNIIGVYNCDSNFNPIQALYNGQGTYATDALSNSILYLKISPGNGILISFNLTVIFAGYASTSESTLTREELKVYPSPSMSDIKISFTADKTDMVVNVFSLNGQLVYQDDNKREVGIVNELELNVSGYQQGIYFVKVGDETVKLVR